MLAERLVYSGRIATRSLLALLFAAGTAPADASTALINPGDQLNVVVYNHPELSEAVKVDSRGGISLPVAGYVTVMGLDLMTIDKTLEHRLSQFVRYPAVEVQIVAESESVFVAGGPGGILTFSPGETLATAIADIEKAFDREDPQENNRLVLTDQIDHSRIDLHKVSINRGGKRLGTFDTLAMRSSGDPGPMLHANDTIVFQNKPIAIFVTGSVEKPGLTYLEASEPLSDAIEQAGGVLSSAATSHIELASNRSATRRIALGDPIFAEPAVQGESLLVPVAPRVQVNGLVAKPGPVVLQHDFTLLGAINTAGGINKYANIKDVQLVRDGTTTSYDITRLTFGDLSQNPELRDGDSVFVPEGHRVDFTAVFGTLIGLRNLVY